MRVAPSLIDPNYLPMFNLRLDASRRYFGVFCAGYRRCLNSLMPVAATQLAPEKKPLSSLFNSPGKRDVVVSLALAVVTLLIYNNVTHFDFINFDDDQYVTSNHHVQAGVTWKTLTWAFHSTDAANWHPVTWLSHALDYQLFHMNPAGHHYTSVLLHAINAILIFLLLRWATGLVWRSATVAALFALHPINVESVAWVAERKNVLCTLFFLLAIAGYGWYVRRPGIARYLSVAGLFALGLMSKPMVITFPFVLLLLDYWPLGRLNFGMATPEQEARSASAFPARSLRYLCLEKLPLLALSVASAVITMVAQRGGGAVRTWTEAPFASRVENAIVSYVLYIGKALWPAHLSAMYPYAGSSLRLWEVIAAFGFLLIATAFAIGSRKHRYVTVGWFFFIGTLVPVIGLVQVGKQAMADRYAYIPLLGLFVLAVWLVADAAQRWKLSPRYLVPLTQVVVLGLAFRTTVQADFWQDSVTLWSHALAVTSNNFVAHDNLGEALMSQGKDEEAIVHLRAANQIDPADPANQLNIGVYEKRHGHLTEAIARYDNVLRLTSDRQIQAFAFTNLGSAYRRLGDFPKAHAYYQAALALDKDATVPLIGLGLLANKTGNSAEAITYFERLTQAQATDVAYLLLAGALRNAGYPDQANAAVRRASAISRNLREAQDTANRMLLE
jgi:protein O-mannosyl-transferase